MTDIQRAARFFILIKESFGADVRSFGLRPRDMDKAKDYLLQVSKRLNKVVIENLDFQKILKNYDKSDALFYLDPPYYETEKYYPDRFMPEDHVRLKEALDVIKGKFVLSYNDCEYIRELYRGYHIIEVEHIDRICEVLDCSVEELIEYIPDKVPKTGKHLVIEEHGNRKTGKGQ